MDFIESEIFNLGVDRGLSDLIPVNELVDAGLKKLENLFHKKISITGVPSGFHDLDDLTSGFQLSELIILAARPSMGKTALSLNIALHNALNKKKVAFFSLEMAREQVLMRLLAALSKINLSRLINGQVGDHSWSRLIAAAAKLSEQNYLLMIPLPFLPMKFAQKPAA